MSSNYITDNTRLYEVEFRQVISPTAWRVVRVFLHQETPSLMSYLEVMDLDGPSQTPISISQDDITSLISEALLLKRTKP